MDALSILAKLASPVFGLITRWGWDRFARSSAGQRAIQGDDFANEASLEYLVKTELLELASGDLLPLELRSEECRNWLQHGDNVELFVQVLVLRAGGDLKLALQTEEKLATEYERIIGETRKRASGPLTLVVSFVMARLQATNKGRQVLQNALELRNSAQLFRLEHPELRDFPTDADLSGVRAMALGLLEVGKSNWKMPRFIAPLNLDAREEQDSKESYPTSVTALSEVIDAGGSVVLFGEGGIGKTTFLLDLCSLCIVGEKRRIPLFIDAAVWARSKATLLDYIANSASARLYGVTPAKLVRLAEAGFLVIMVNGWNEIPELQKMFCRDEFNQLTATATALNTVVASRTSSDTASLSAAKRVRVQGLSWEGQSAVIRDELSEELAAPLLALLAVDTPLRHAARSPLILRGLVENAKKGAVETSSVFDLLGAVVTAFEDDAQRTWMLKSAPIHGYQNHFLEELACQLTSLQTLSISRDEALPMISLVADKLVGQRLIDSSTSLASVLDVLVSHHLLHFEGGEVRFAHQRFREYFAATRLFRECLDATDSTAFLRSAVNLTGWDDSVVLVAGKLKEMGNTAGRVRLVKAAAAVDMCLACDLAGLCSLRKADDPVLYGQLILSATELTASALKEVRDLGVACQIATGFTDFAKELWPLLESDSSETRLHIHRLNGIGISLTQLGLHAEERVAAWPSERRVEFLHEVANNPGNYNFIARTAFAESDSAVRAAAISALFWHFPASQAPIDAWLDAPAEVQTEHNVMSYVTYALKRGFAGEAVNERLRVMAASDTLGSEELSLTLMCPDEVSPRELDVIFARLSSMERGGESAALVAIAQAHAPDRILSLAQELVLGSGTIQDWTIEYFTKAPIAVQVDVFERAWGIFQSPTFNRLSAETLGPLADHRQIERSVVAWLRYCMDQQAKQNEVGHDRNRQLRQLLACANGNALLKVVMEQGQTASYNEAAELLDLIVTRIGGNGNIKSRVVEWLPAVEQVRQLVSTFSGRTESAEDRQDRVYVLLSCIASHVAPSEFSELLLETCRRQLDAWVPFHQWMQKPKLPRPNNPSLGNYVISALVRWGPDALPSLLELMNHPSAIAFIPEAIGRIVNLPWMSKGEVFPRSIGSDAHEGERRRQAGRVLLQPDGTHQSITDAAAQVFSQLLMARVENLLAEQLESEQWKPRKGSYDLRNLVNIAANMPSPVIEEAVNYSLASGLMDTYGFVDALRGLIRQGRFVSDARVVVQLEVLYEQEANAEWFDQSTKYKMAELCELMYYVSPPHLLGNSLNYYLEQWQRFAYPNEIIWHLGATRSNAALTTLVQLGRSLAPNRQPNELALALASTLSPVNFVEFLQLMADGTLFTWCSSVWDLERIAPKVAAAAGDDPKRWEAFVDTCRQVRSPLADALANATLVHRKGSDTVRLQLGLDAVDAGRAIDSAMPGYRMLLKMFELEVPLNDEGHFEISPKSCNELRAQLYKRARGSEAVAVGCKRLLAEIECLRRESGRPPDETRHPDSSDGLAWTTVLAV